MPVFVNPFRKQDASTFPGVLIPLKRVARPVDAEDGNATNADGLIAGSEDEALLPNDDAPVLEDLRAQLEKEVEGVETAYDREYREYCVTGEW